MGPGEVAALVGAAFWAATNLILRGSIFALGGATAQAWRGVVSSIVFASIFLALRTPNDILTIPVRTIGVLLLSVLLSMVLGDILQFTAVRHLGVARALPISSSYPLLTLLLATTTLGEQLTARIVAGAVLVIVGVTLVALPRRSLREQEGQRHRRRIGRMEGGGAGVAFALGSAVCVAAATALVRVVLRGGNVDVLAANMIRHPVSAVLCTLISVFQRRQPPWRVERRYVLPLCLAGLTGLVSGLCYLTAIQVAGASRTATLNAASPIFGLLGAVMFLGERPTPRNIVGTLVAFLGIVLVVST